MTGALDAVIVGAGPAGSSAAILLARAGWSVALVEKQRFPRRKVCGECVAASNLPLLAALGVGPAFAAAAGPELRRVALLRGEREVVAELPAAADARHRWGRALGRETLDTLLLERARAAGAQVLQPWSVRAIDGAPGGWHCEVRAVDGGAALTLHAPLVIDAHGSWEPLPTARPGRRQARRAGDLFAFKANFRGAALAEGVLPVLALDGGYGGMVVADGGLTTLACCVRGARLDACRRAAPGLRAGAAVEAWLRRECSGVRAALREAVRVGPWLAAGPLDPGVRVDGGGGVLRIGNAAGEAHPIIGEGMSMALQSAWLLCAQLLEAAPLGARPGPAWQHEAGRRYAAQWRRQFAPRLRLAAAFAQLAMRPATAAPLMALAQAWPGLLTLGARWGGKARSSVDAATIARLTAPRMPADASAEASNPAPSFSHDCASQPRGTT
ncbi:MAG: FAD-dependent monooxygenase [Burkholderiales bacterium]|nr:FAD-dependent monooxygenase [Burkholderiales bacterium]